MRQPMLRARMLRQGAHQVNSSGSSGATCRWRSTRPRPMTRSSRVRSSGRCPIALALRSFGWTSFSVRVTFRSPHRSSGRCELVQGRQEPYFGIEILAAVRHVDGRHGQFWQCCCDDAMFEVECRMVVGGTARKPLGSHEQCHTRVALAAVPATPVAVEVRQPEWQLIRSRLQFLQAHDVRAIRLEKGLQFTLACTDTVDVPGQDRE